MRWEFCSSVDGELGPLNDLVRLLTTILHLSFKEVRETLSELYTLYELKCVSVFIGLLWENGTLTFTGNRFSVKSDSSAFSLSTVPRIIVIRAVIDTKTLVVLQR